MHILTHLHPSVALADLVKDIKIASSGFIKEKGIFKQFNNWQEGYGAFTYSIKEKDKLIAYVKNQEEHHQLITFRDEYIALLKEHEIVPMIIGIDEKFLL